MVHLASRPRHRNWGQRHHRRSQARAAGPGGGGGASHRRATCTSTHSSMHQQQTPMPTPPLLHPTSLPTHPSTAGTEQPLPAAATATTTDVEDQEAIKSLPLQLATRSLQLSGPARHLAREIGRADEDYVRRVGGWHRHRSPVASTGGGNLSDGGDGDGICCSSSTSTRSECSSSSSSSSSNSSNGAKGASASSPVPLPPVMTDDSNEERARCA